MGITCDGHILCIECKTGGSVQSKQQINFQRMIEDFGGRYIVARSPEDAVNFLKGLNLL